MADLLIGQQLGAYEIISLLGQGGMATVYRARQTLAGRVQREVAIKVMETRLAQYDEFVARFEREAQTIVSLSHAHILKVFDYGHDGFNGYHIGCLDYCNREVKFNFKTSNEMWDAIEIIRDCIGIYNNNAKHITLAFSNPPTWLELAKRRVAKGISSTKQHRDNEHRQAMRTIDT